MKRLGRDDVFCLLLGSSGPPTPFEKELERAIEAADLHGRVQIGPYVDDMPAAYMLADVVVATGGTRQGFSRALVEAQAMGRPVVAEDGGGAAETVRAGVTGWLAPAADAGALAEAMQSAISLPTERRAELARAAQEHVRSRYALATANASWCSSMSGCRGNESAAAPRPLPRPRRPRRSAARTAWARLRGPPAGGVLDRFLAPPSGVQQSFLGGWDADLGRSRRPQLPVPRHARPSTPRPTAASRAIGRSEIPPSILLGEVAFDNNVWAGVFAQPDDKSIFP